MNSVCENERFKSWWPTSWRACEQENWTRQRHGQQADHEDNRGSKCVGQRAGHASLGGGAGGWTVTFNEDQRTR